MLTGDQSVPKTPYIRYTYVATIAKPIAPWAINTNTINNSQKGFLPYESCCEHKFVLQSCLQDAQKNKKVHVTRLDLKNAFGKAPTEHLQCNKVYGRARTRSYHLYIQRYLYQLQHTGKVPGRDTQVISL